MKLVTPNCPHCKVPAVKSHETIPGAAGISIEPDGSFDFTGGTDVWWDDQTTNVDAKGRMTLECDCGRTWKSAVLDDEGRPALLTQRPAPTAQLIMLNQPVYARVMGKAIRVVAMVTGAGQARIDAANEAMAENPNLALLHDDNECVSYLAAKDDPGAPVTKMETFRT